MEMVDDKDPVETREWLEALDEVVKHGGPQRASFLLLQLAKHAIDAGLRLPPAITSPFRNTIAPADEKMMPGDLFMERRIRSLVRWNALAMTTTRAWADTSRVFPPAPRSMMWASIIFSAVLKAATPGM